MQRDNALKRLCAILLRGEKIAPQGPYGKFMFYRRGRRSLFIDPNGNAGLGRTDGG